MDGYSYVPAPHTVVRYIGYTFLWAFLSANNSINADRNTDKHADKHAFQIEIQINCHKHAFLAVILQFIIACTCVGHVISAAPSAYFSKTIY